ncbi:MAG TPA: NAD(P)-dependent alcohol dehydrogenase [Noviherbaspirillum sp.]|uniref:NAD(P)-dependent alcohol dehydrogenase n=1 Tax=Noviherbaspirillum sp. TaxID=1926288 RepID=UPI002D7318B5|nr:NAD(P)-dependent alcohol dehydrogenase [Noviherbaspirillum sp.]HYD96008.1 NAD(P)-dependent alcohol dehydrogenase [Noviherbaspirillum sp.]
MLSSTGYGATSATEPLSKLNFQRRDLQPDDVQIDILFCGVCHSDLHTARNEWGNTVYPVVPGHEIIGRVTAVGSQVTHFKAGDLVGVGCLVDSCQQCGSCAEGLEQYCENGFVGTYNGEEMHSGGMTYGGYSTNIVVRDKFVLRIPERLDPAGAAPLLCAGITTYSPLKQWHVSPGKKVGIVGLGGLGHMGLKLAHAMGAYVVLFTTSQGKREDAKRLGADEVVVSRNTSEMREHRDSFDFILNTVAAPHALDPFMELLKRDGTMVLVGAPASPHPSPQVFNLIMKRRRLAGSLIGGIAETQEMLDFCGERGIVADIETIRIQDINDAYERMLKSDVKYRFVIDMTSLKQEA